ncbi:nuclear transport factor 2 family protein [Solirhodobacter olei]|uniref:nuclear transport factor 2 family protein n=1 Tax=Solirhodobacter olei TaxID=2493082 RepID=UPI0013E2F9CE|nr:nuclear transport factor 2 family protein [Solirhodobacter olei]
MTDRSADRLAIIEAISKYAFGYDEADFSLLEDVFTEGAISGGKITGTEISWGPMSGRSEVLSGLKSMREGQSIQPRHCVTNALFSELSDDRARLRCYLTLMASEHAKAGIATCGRLDVEAAREDGNWKLSRLDVTLDAPF